LRVRILLGLQMEGIWLDEEPFLKNGKSLKRDLWVRVPLPPLIYRY
jgi:hypothetical protein